MVTIVNKHWHKPTKDDYYCGRGSVFGNPYSHKIDTKAQFIVSTREEAIDRYLSWFEKERVNNAKFHMQLNSMMDYLLRGNDLNLVCYCAPLDCHCRHIKNYLEEQISDIKRQESAEIKS